MPRARIGAKYFPQGEIAADALDRLGLAVGGARVGEHRRHDASEVRSRFRPRAIPGVA